jgi:hypothetical protein
MKIIKYLVFLIIFNIKTVFAADIYDGKYLSIPQVIVGDKTYINVVVTVGSVISVGGTLSNPTIYVNIQSFQLSKYLSDGLGLDVLSNTNQSVSNQFDLSHQEYSATTHTYTKFDTFGVGNFYLPSASYASIQGITGVLTSLSWGSGGTSSWALNNANVDASTLTGTWQLFWTSVYNNSGTIMASSLNNGNMTCTSSRGQSLTQSLTSNPIDVKPFILSCIS